MPRVSRGCSVLYSCNAWAACAVPLTPCVVSRTDCKEELVIRYEAPGMIHFDLVDLPGIDNGSPLTVELVQQYINRETMAHTFMLIFQAASRGDTRMQYSLCLKHILQVAGEAQKIGADSTPRRATKSWIKTHCLGVITMFDKKLEKNSTLSADEYDLDAATTLDSWLKCKIHEEHLMKFDWVVVLVRLLLQALMLRS
jgi:hypothetical protein